MATLARWNRTIQDGAGNALNATITVYKESDGLIATIYSDRAGATPKSNPFTLSNSDKGLAFFHVAGGAYKIVATYGSYVQTWRYEAIGTAGEYDVGSFIGSGQAPTIAIGRTALKAVDTATYKAAYLVESGRDGSFVWKSGDYSAQVALDTQEGVFVKADAVAASSGAWVRALSNDLRAEMFGAVGDTKVFDAACTISSGSPNLTVTGATFTANDVGKKIVIGGAGVAGAPLATTINAYVDATHVTLSANASTALAASTVHVAYGTDDTTALQCYLNVCGYIGAPVFLGDSANGYAISSKLQAMVKRDLQATDTSPSSDVHFTDNLPFNIIGYGKAMLVAMATMTAMLELIFDTSDSDIAPFYSTVEGLQFDGCNLATSGVYSNYAMHVIWRNNRFDKLTRGVEYTGYGVASVQRNTFRCKYGVYLSGGGGDSEISGNDFYNGEATSAAVYLGYYGGDLVVTRNIVTNEQGYSSAYGIWADGSTAAASEEIRHVVISANEFCGVTAGIYAIGKATGTRNIWNWVVSENHTNPYGSANAGTLLVAQDATDFVIDGNFVNGLRLSDSTGKGVDLTRCERFVISRNLFGAVGLQGITLVNCNDNVISDNRFDNVGKTSSSLAIVDISGAASLRNTVVRNVFRQTSGSYAQNGVKESASADYTVAHGNSFDTVTTPYTVVGAHSSMLATTDNTIARYDGSVGQLQSSGVAIDDSNNITGATAIDIGNSDTTLSRAAAGDVNIEGNLIYRAGGTDVPIADGGTGSSTAAAARTALFGVSTTVDNTLPRYDGTTGAIQTSGIVVDDSNNVSGAGTIASAALSPSVTSGDVLSGTFQAATNFSAGLTVKKRGATGDANAAVASGGEIGYHSFYAWDGSAYGRGAFCIVAATEAWSTTAHGASYAIYVTANGSTTNSLAMFIGQDKSALFKGSVKSDSATDGIGYASGAGGTATQATSKSTGVTLNKVCGQITMNNAALAAGAKVSFVVTNSTIAATDGLIVWIASGGTANAYRAQLTAVAAGSFTITVENITAGSLSESPVVGFAKLLAVAA